MFVNIKKVNDWKPLKLKKEIGITLFMYDNFKFQKVFIPYNMYIYKNDLWQVFENFCMSFFLYVITNSMLVKRVQEMELSIVVCSNERFVEGEKMSKVRGTRSYSRLFFMARQSAEKTNEGPSRYNILCIRQRFQNFFEFRIITVK